MKIKGLPKLKTTSVYKRFIKDKKTNTKINTCIQGTVDFLTKNTCRKKTKTYVSQKRMNIGLLHHYELTNILC